MYSARSRWEISIWYSECWYLLRVDGWQAAVSPVILFILTVFFNAYCLAMLSMSRLNYSSFYEGHAVDKTTFPVRLFKLLGIETIICKYI